MERRRPADKTQTKPHLFMLGAVQAATQRRSRLAGTLLALSGALLFSTSLSGQAEQPIPNGASCDSEFPVVGGITQSPAPAKEPSAAVCFAQVSFTDPRNPEMYSRYGQAFIESAMLEGSSWRGYINVERYADGQPAGWIVKNLPVGGSSPGFSPIFDLGASGRQASISAYVDFTITPLPDDSSLRNGAPQSYALDHVQHLAAAIEPNNVFQDVVCYKSDANFWAGQAPVALVATETGKFAYKDGTGWIIKTKDPNQLLLVTAEHNFTKDEVANGKVTVTFYFQQPNCRKEGEKPVSPPDAWGAEVDQLLESSVGLDYAIVSLKIPPGKTAPTPLQALYKDSKKGDVVTIPEHPGGSYKYAGYYYDLKNTARCQVSDPKTNQAKCGVAKGSSGSPVLDATQAGDTPYAIGLVVRGGNIAGAIYTTMSSICDDDAEKMKLLDCKKP